MKRLLLPVLLACGCAGNDGPPADLLPRERFEQVLVDAQLVEARVNQELVIDKRTDMPIERYYEEVFSKHGTTKEQFRKTFDWYTAHPKELMAVYEAVLIDLQHQADSTRH